MQNHEKLSSFLYWATSTAQRSDSGKSFKCDGSYGLGILEESQSEHEEPKTLKLLRWLTACVIRGEISRNLNYLNASKRCDLKDLKSLLEHIHGRSGLSDHSRWILAVNIYYLQQLFNRDCRFLPSVVSTLCLLVLSGTSNCFVFAFLLKCLFLNLRWNAWRLWVFYCACSLPYQLDWDIVSIVRLLPLTLSISLGKLGPDRLPHLLIVFVCYSGLDLQVFGNHHLLIIYKLGNNCFCILKWWMCFWTSPCVYDVVYIEYILVSICSGIIWCQKSDAPLFILT